MSLIRERPAPPASLVASDLKTIVVGLLNPADTGGLAYALNRSLAEPSRIRVVRPIWSHDSDVVASSVPVEACQVIGEPGEVLLSESRRGDILVVQTPRNHLAALNDDVLVRLRRSAECLLVEVDDEGRTIRASGPHGRDARPLSRVDLPHVGLRASAEVVVGFDGSAAGLEAVRWAVACAQENAFKVRVVMAYTPSEDGAGTQPARDAAEVLLSACLKQVRPGRATMVQQVIAGEPTDVLLNCSEGARLLVLGRHGTSGMIHSALGSVGDTCARLASCPVVIVPAGGTPVI